jgi:hypothetical protein
VRVVDGDRLGAVRARVRLGHDLDRASVLAHAMHAARLAHGEVGRGAVDRDREGRWSDGGDDFGRAARERRLDHRSARVGLRRDERVRRVDRDGDGRLPRAQRRDRPREPFAGLDLAGVPGQRAIGRRAPDGCGEEGGRYGKAKEAHDRP